MFNWFFITVIYRYKVCILAYCMYCFTDIRLTPNLQYIRLCQICKVTALSLNWVESAYRGNRWRLITILDGEYMNNHRLTSLMEAWLRILILYASLTNGRVMQLVCPSVRSFRIFVNMLWDINWNPVHLVGGTTHQVWNSLQSGYFDLLCNEKGVGFFLHSDLIN